MEHYGIKLTNNEITMLHNAKNLIIYGAGAVCKKLIGFLNIIKISW